MIIAGFGLALASGICFSLGRWEGFFLAVLLCAPGVLYRSRVNFSRVKIAYFDDKCLTIAFRNAEYAREFAQVNGIPTSR